MNFCIKSGPPRRRHQNGIRCANILGKEQDAAGPSPCPLRAGGLLGLGKDKATQARSSAVRPPAPWAAFRTQSVAPRGLDLTAPGPARRPRRAPPAPPGKMAPAEQLRHQPWRRARPSAILAPSSRSPPPHRKIPHSGRLRGRERHWARALSAKISATRVCLLFVPAGRTGPAGDAWLGGGSSARREDSSRPGRGSPAVLPSQAARRRGRGNPAGRHAPRTGPGRAGGQPAPSAPLRGPTPLSSSRPPAEAAGRREPG